MFQYNMLQYGSYYWDGPCFRKYFQMLSSRFSNIRNLIGASITQTQTYANISDRVTNFPEGSRMLDGSHRPNRFESIWIDSKKESNRKKKSIRFDFSQNRTESKKSIRVFPIRIESEGIINLLNNFYKCAPYFLCICSCILSKSIVQSFPNRSQ